MSDEKIYVRLSAGLVSRFFRAAYAYVDTKDNCAGRVLAQCGLKIRKKSVYMRGDDPSSVYVIVVATLKKKHRAMFEECMERHQKNSILLGWGNTKECGEIVGDIHKAAEV